MVRDPRFTRSILIKIQRCFEGLTLDSGAICLLAIKNDTFQDNFGLRSGKTISWTVPYKNVKQVNGVDRHTKQHNNLIGELWVHIGFIVRFT